MNNPTPDTRHEHTRSRSRLRRDPNTPCYKGNSDRPKTRDSKSRSEIRDQPTRFNNQEHARPRIREITQPENVGEMEKSFSYYMRQSRDNNRTQENWGELDLRNKLGGAIPRKTTSYHTHHKTRKARWQGRTATLTGQICPTSTNIKTDLQNEPKPIIPKENPANEKYIPAHHSTVTISDSYETNECEKYPINSKQQENSYARYYPHITVKVRDEHNLKKMFNQWTSQRVTQHNEHIIKKIQSGIYLDGRIGFGEKEKGLFKHWQMAADNSRDENMPQPISYLHTEDLLLKFIQILQTRGRTL